MRSYRYGAHKTVKNDNFRGDTMFNNPSTSLRGRSTVVYTLISPAMLNVGEPYVYMRHVLERIADHSINLSDELLPWKVQLAPFIERLAIEVTASRLQEDVEPTDDFECIGTSNTYRIRRCTARSLAHRADPVFRHTH